MLENLVEYSTFIRGVCCRTVAFIYSAMQQKKKISSSSLLNVLPFKANVINDINFIERKNAETKKCRKKKYRKRY
jgi:hypothetical protein